jgi:hypothetical protein
MLKSTLRWAVRACRGNALCRGPVQGSAARLEARFRALVEEIGLDRLPYRTSVPRLAGWLESLNSVVGSRPPSRPHRLLLFSVMAHWVEYCLPLALALAGRDCLVDYVWLPYPRMDCDIPLDLWCKDLSAHWSLPSWVRLHPRVRVINLLHVKPGPVTDEQRELARRWARLDTQYYLRRELIDEEREEDVKAVFTLRCRRNLDCLARMGTWLRQNSYDSSLIPGAAIYEFAVMYEWLRNKLGLGVVTFDFGERKGVIFPSDGAPAPHLDTRALWAADAPHTLTPEREQQIRSFLLRRELPNWQEGDYLWQGQTISPKEAGDLCAELKLDPRRPVALLCTNIAHDSAVLGMTRAFTSMAEWLVETVGWFAGRPDWQLVVRCHPAEAAFPSNEPVPELIARRYPDLPDNIRIIRPADRVNTYGLMRLSRFGLVFSTTAGLEMAVRGLPVVVSGRVHYDGKGFTFDPANPPEYFARLEQLTATPNPPRLTPRQVELALCCADVYFFGYSRPIMWYNPGETDKDMQLCSLEQLLHEDCPRGFLETLDFFAGRHLVRQRARKAS